MSGAVSPEDAIGSRRGGAVSPEDAIGSRRGAAVSPEDAIGSRRGGAGVLRGVGEHPPCPILWQC